MTLLRVMAYDGLVVLLFYFIGTSYRAVPYSYKWPQTFTLHHWNALLFLLCSLGLQILTQFIHNDHKKTAVGMSPFVFLK